VYKSLVERHGKEKQLSAVGIDYGTILRLHLSSAVCDFSKDEGLAYLSGAPVRTALELFAPLFRSEPVLIGERIGGDCVLLDLSHIAWLIGDRELGEFLIEVANRPVILKNATKFWKEYLRGFLALVQRTSFSPGIVKCTGIVRHWATYLPLLSDLTNQRPVNDSLAAIVESFNRANRDKRLYVSGIELDPTGKAPVRWDFRLESIRWYAGRVYGVQF
jgi:hypothetical protein